ncbi:hypothetical protein H5410_037223 [Solanum commersonii]|uniref:Uncharacterized protein n=1 Tax=Solanum commersonii TaxID=4109 RepID=A0A9J5Y7V9_SOLCO|nr:hypothetical protein H5410_037223 [Solanum commersonii]
MRKFPIKLKVFDSQSIKVLKAIEQICKIFLSTGAVTVSKKTLVSWDNICEPHTAGGLNILNCNLTCKNIPDSQELILDCEEDLGIKGSSIAGE